MTAYVAAQRPLRGSLRRAKTLAPDGPRPRRTTRSTVRRRLRRDHWELWMAPWASVEEIGGRASVIVSGRVGACRCAAQR